MEAVGRLQTALNREGRRISTHAMVIDEIGTGEGGCPIEVLFGALTVRQWGIRPVPDEERLDLSHYPDVFIEFGSTTRLSSPKSEPARV